MFDEDGMEDEMDEVVGAVLDEIGVDLSSKVSLACLSVCSLTALFRWHQHHGDAWARKKRLMLRQMRCSSACRP
jgi:hypothetical protein